MHYVMYHSKHATDHENHKNTKMWVYKADMAAL